MCAHLHALNWHFTFILFSSETHLKVLNQWKEDDEVYYDGTNVYKAAKDTIQSCSVIVLVGGPGCGKTAMARHLALKYYQYGWEVVPVCRVEEISQYADVKLKQIFVLDNIFGKFTVDIFMYSTVNNHKDSIMNAMNKDSKLFFTCRKSVYKEAVKLKSFVLETVIDLESKENTLNDDEKENILTKHCRYTGVPEKIFTNLLFSTSHIMFPLLCKVFTTKHEIHGSMERFLANPYRCLILELDKLECISPHQYAALILCLLSNNMLSTNKTLDDKMKLDAYNTCGVNLGTSDKQIRNALTYLVGTYFVECKNDLTFIHDAIYEIVAYHYGRTRPHIILKYMKSNFIATKVTVHMDQGLYSNSDLLIVIDKCHYEQMAERLYTDLKSLELFDVFINKSLSYPPFLDVFIETLTKKPYKELQTLLFLEQNESKIKHRCFDEKIEKKDKQEEQMRLELLSSVIYDKELNKTYSIRVISWIIYYGHTSLLQTSVDLVLKNHESTNMIFGSDITEQTRLLTLGCYSGNPDMVNTILKYVNGNCINRTSQNGNMRSSNLHRSRSPLTAACYSGHLSVVQVLLLNNAKINQCDNYGRFPLHIASCKGHYDVIKCLVQNGADVNHCDKINNSPLYTASESGYYDVVEYLVQNGANVNQCDDFNISPLYKASEVGHYDVVKYLVKNGANINQCNSANETPLFATVQMGHYNIVTFLIKNDADLTFKAKNCFSLLQLAVFLNFPEIRKELIRAENKKEMLSGNNHLFNILVEIKMSGVFSNDRSCQDIDRMQVLSELLFNTINWKGPDCLKHLLKLGLNVNQCDINGQSLLNRILKEPDVSEKETKMTILFENGVDITVRNYDHMSLIKKINQFTMDKTLNEYFKQYDLHEYHRLMLLKQHIRRNSI